MTQESSNEQAKVRYFTPTERSAMAKYGIVFTKDELELATQVEKVLANEGQPVRGSVFQTSDITPTSNPKKAK